MENTQIKEVGALTPSIDATVTLVSVYVSNNTIDPVGFLNLIADVHSEINQMMNPEPVVIPIDQKPAVPIKQSITEDYLICLEDGQKFKSLKRHISTHYGMTMDDYRKKWKLPADYPAVAPSYAAARSKLAKDMGLGRKPKST